MKANFSQRRSAVSRELRARKLDCLLVTHPSNCYYLTGFTGDSGALILSSSGAILITDGRFTIQASDEARGVRVIQQKGSLFTAVGEYLRAKRFHSYGTDFDHLTVSQAEALRKATGSSCKPQDASGLVELLRSRKDSAELSAMRKAALLASKVMEAAIRRIRPGVRENELAAEIEYQMRRLGASGPSFETIVASGWRSALPHARPTSKPLRKNELVVLDLGVILGHYCSDMTRTVYLGKAPRRVRQWYDAVNEARSAAIDSVQAGVTCGEVDAAARLVLSQRGFESLFVHSTGHGVGLEVHEAPRVAKGQSIRLEAGNVITIEPGIYVAGTGGIRIEDDVVVLPRGREVITRVKRDLIEI